MPVDILSKQTGKAVLWNGLNFKEVNDFLTSIGYYALKLDGNEWKGYLGIFKDHELIHSVNSYINDPQVAECWIVYFDDKLDILTVDTFKEKFNIANSYRTTNNV